MSPPYGFPSGALGSWADRLRPASFRGIPFAVRESTIRRGRDVVVHRYPYKDVVWVEDLGRGARQITFSGFLVGDDVFDQRDRMAAAAETAGPGALVHPSLGSLTATLVEKPTFSERADLGRVVEIAFSFIEGAAAQPSQPSVTADTQGALTTAAGASDTAAAANFTSNVVPPLLLGANVIASGLAVVNSYVRLVVAACSDASLIAAAVTGLVGNFGRYSNGGRTAPQPAAATVDSALSALTTARTAVQTAAAAAQTAAGSTPATSLPTALAALLAALATAAQDPADQIRLLSGLAAFTVAPLPGNAPIGAAIAAMQTAAAALARRLALSALARAIASYQPSSYNDAMAVLEAATALLDAEILVAADAGDTASYGGLRGLRTALVNDLITRGSQLPQLTTIVLPQSLPALVVAWRLYQDATRADDLIARVDPPHPAFMPLSFEALSS